MNRIRQILRQYFQGKDPMRPGEYVASRRKEEKVRIAITERIVGISQRNGLQPNDLTAVKASIAIHRHFLLTKVAPTEEQIEAHFTTTVAGA